MWNLIQNSQAVNKMCGHQESHSKDVKIQRGDQEMAVMVG